MSTTGVKQIAADRVEHCYLCGNNGSVLYCNLRDTIFGAPGTWGFRRCSNPECGVVWLDPLPPEHEIWKAYANYYTHTRAGSLHHQTFLRRTGITLLDTLLKLAGVLGERERIRGMYLGGVAPGRLLEIGCGDGTRLEYFAKAGWIVEGQEVDPNIAAMAENNRFTIHIGKLADLPLPADSYDAIVFNHVIEHVHDPLRFLGECHRLLKPGGRLVAVTPNVSGYGSKRFGKNWRGLEPPRHVYLYSPRSLAVLLSKTDLSPLKIFTTCAHAEIILSASCTLEKKYSFTAAAGLGAKRIEGFVLQIRALLRHVADKESGEECVVIATKKQSK
jgi:SAM-dependent methyltransferase